MVALKNSARRLADYISEAKPILDRRLPDGSGLASVIPPDNLGGVTLPIRKCCTNRTFSVCGYSKQAWGLLTGLSRRTRLPALGFESKSL
jgi:hypothetical protein